MSVLPTERLDVIWPADVLPDSDQAGAIALEQILAKADEMRGRGERAWFEVRYPLPPRAPGDDCTDAERLADRESTFDALEVLADGTIHTVPPYAELLGGLS